MTARSTLETRIADITRIRIAVIGEDLTLAARSTRHLKGDTKVPMQYGRQSSCILKGLETSTEARDIRETEKLDSLAIRIALGLDKQQTWRQRHVGILDREVSGTGSWPVDRHDGLRQQVNIGQSAYPVFAPSSGEETGKAFLACAAI